MSRRPGSRAKMIWSVATLMAMVIAIYFTTQFLLFYHSRGRYAVEDGKRLIIAVETGEITMRAMDNAKPEETSPLEDAAKQEEIKAPIKPVMYDGKARLGVILMGYGLNYTLTQKAMDFPQNVAISLSPYSAAFNDWAVQAKSKGHELLVDLPAETSNYPLEDPGPLAVLNESGEAKQLARIRTLLEACKSCIGAILAPLENISQSQETMRPVMEALQKSNVTLVYNEKPTSSYLLQEARAIGLSTVSHYIILDDVPSKDAIDAKLEMVRKIIMDEQKTVVAVGQPYPITLERLQVWANDMQSRGLMISPFSTLINSQ